MQYLANRRFSQRPGWNEERNEERNEEFLDFTRAPFGEEPDLMFHVFHVLGGGFKYFLFSPLPGEDSHSD